MAIAEKLQNIVNEKQAQIIMTNYGLPSGSKITASTKFIDYPKYIFNAFLEALRTPDTLFTNLPKKSGSGSVISLNDTANAPMRITLGASELSQAGTPSSPQAVHTISGSNKVVVCGKNLFDKNNVVLGYRISAIGIDYADSDYYVSDFIKVKPNSTYTKNSPQEDAYHRFACYTSNNENSYIQNSVSALNTITTPSTCEYLRFCGLKTELDTAMLVLGNSVGSYEPYTSQEADIDLSSTNIAQSNWARDFVNAVADLSRAKLVDYNGRSCLFFIAGAGYQSYSTKNLTLGIKFKENTQYTISLDLLKENSALNTIAIHYTDDTYSEFPTVSTLGTWEHKTITSTANKTILYIQPYYRSGDTYIDLNSWQINEGTQELPYMPYYDYGEYCKIGNYEDKFIRTSGKNLFDKSTILENSLISATGAINTSTGNFVSDYIFLKGGTTYYNGTRGYGNAGFYDLNKTFIERADLNQNTTYTPSNDCYVRLNGKMENIDTYMLNEGTTALPYEPYGSNEWYLKKNIKKYIVLGTENLNNQSTRTNTFRFTLVTNDKLPNNSNVSQIMCNRGNGVPDYYWNRDEVGVCEIKNPTLASIIFSLPINEVNSYATAQTWFINNETILYYILANPTYTQITGTLETQLENVYKNMLSQAKQTNISQENNDLSFELSVSAIEEL